MKIEYNLTGPKSTDSYTYDSGNELLTSREHPHQDTQNEYDLNGNLIKKTEMQHGKAKTITSYAYDDENRLIKVEITKQVGSSGMRRTYGFTYDPFGRRISKTVEREELDDDNNIIDKLLNKLNCPRTTYYIYDHQNIIAEYDQSGKQTATYIHGPNIDEPLASEIRNTRIYYHADGLGSITALTNHMGVAVHRYAYDSFGNIKFTPFPHWIKQPFTYTGREYDSETGLYYYRARYYDPKAGRFITKDPIGFDGGDVNLYTYVGNKPVNATDPSGKFKFYGNYCGPNYGDLAAMNWIPSQLDGGLDKCCYDHDKCYADNCVNADLDLSKSGPEEEQCNNKLCSCLKKSNPPCKYWITKWALLKTFNCNGVPESILWWRF